MRVNITEYGEDRVEEVHIDPWDTWNMDSTLALIIIPMLKQLKETNIGHPADTTEEEWLDIQDRMIWSFEQSIGGYTGYNDVSSYRSYIKQVQEGFNLFGEYFMNLWD